MVKDVKEIKLQHLENFKLRLWKFYRSDFLKLPTLFFSFNEKVPRNHSFLLCRSSSKGNLGEEKLMLLRILKIGG